MAIIAIPSRGPKNWRQAQADPERQWKPGTAAVCLALSWEAAEGEFPAEISRIIRGASFIDLAGLHPLLIIPGFAVPWPDGRMKDQLHLLTLCQGTYGLCPMAVEAVAYDDFGPGISEYQGNGDPGRSTELRFLKETLGIGEIPGGIRYHLVRRFVSTIFLAKRFGARQAVLLMHAFTRENRWFDDFANLLALFNAGVRPGTLAVLDSIPDIRLFAGWCTGNPDLTRVDIR